MVGTTILVSVDSEKERKKKIDDRSPMKKYLSCANIDDKMRGVDIGGDKKWARLRKCTQGQNWYCKLESMESL